VPKLGKKRIKQLFHEYATYFKIVLYKQEWITHFPLLATMTPGDNEIIRFCNLLREHFSSEETLSVTTLGESPYRYLFFIHELIQQIKDDYALQVRYEQEAGCLFSHPTLHKIRSFIESQVVPVSKTKYGYNSDLDPFYSIILDLESVQAAVTSEGSTLIQTPRDVITRRRSRVYPPQTRGPLVFFNGGARVALSRHYCAEKSLSKYLLDLNDGPPESYEQSQKGASNMMNGCLVTIVTGGPGTGKSYLICKQVQWYMQCSDDTRRTQRVVVCAPTNKVVRMLYKKLQKQNVAVKTTASAACGEWPQGYKYVLILDEQSMQDLVEINRLVRKMRPVRIHLFGDTNQLPTVNPGAFFIDMIECRRFPRVHLTVSFRTMDPTLLTNIEAVKNGAPERIQTSKSFTLSARPTVNTFMANYVPAAAAVVALSYRKASVSRLNRDINTAVLRAQDETEHTLIYPGVSVLIEKKELEIRVGMPVVSRVNIRQSTKHIPDCITRHTIQDDAPSILFKSLRPTLRTDSRETGTWCTEKLPYDYCPLPSPCVGRNTLGTVTQISTRAVVVRFGDDTEEYLYPLYRFEELLQPAYAMTVHKAQGLEYPVVVYECCHFNHPGGDYNNLALVAISRAQLSCHVSASHPGVLSAVIKKKLPVRTTNMRSILEGRALLSDTMASLRKHGSSKRHSTRPVPDRPSPKKWKASLECFRFRGE